jgi:predicted nucleic acid-binding protein
MLTQRVLLETSLLLRAFDPGVQDAPELVKVAKQRLKPYLLESDTLLVTTPLIRFEALRGIRPVNPKGVERLNALLTYLGDFEVLPITQATTDLATQLWHKALETGYSLEKRNFDVLHFACAKTYDIELLSCDDKDMRVLFTRQ